ncbi:MAG: carboxypeptidase-like regulatory domain-containing protein, partial [Bryobacteraceae bacterium]
MVVALAIPPAAAQTATGNIRGTVVDASEAVVANVAITLSNASTGLRRRVMTNDRGDFDAPFMPPGEYQISAELTGFQRKVVTGISLQVDQTAVLRIVIEPGAVTQTIEVTSAAPLLDAQTSSLGQIIENKRIVDLPLNGRNPFMLGLLAGGTTPFKGLNTNIPFIAGGGRHSGNDILLDGVDDNIRNFGGDVGRNGISYIPSVDAVQEFKVKTNNFAAEYGRSSGYTVNATIKSGSNELHASLFEFLRNDKLDANNFVSNFVGQRRAPFRQNQYGATLGGPLRLPRYNGRNRTFFFVDYEGTQIRSAAGSSLSDVAPASFRRGDFSSSARKIYDPLSRTLGPTGVVTAELFPNNVLPPSRLDSAILKYQDLMPAPNVSGPESTSRNFFSVSPRGTDRHQGDLKIDHRLFKDNNLMARFSMAQQYRPIQGSYIFSPREEVFHTRNAALSDTHIFSPTV